MARYKMKEHFHALCYAVSVFLFAIGHTKIQDLSFVTSIMVTYGKFIPVLLSIPVLVIQIKSLGIMLVFSLLLLLSFFLRDLSYTVFFIAYFMVACSRTDQKRIYKYYALSVFTVIILTVVLALSGILENDNSWYGRYDLGFTYCTFGPNLFLSACIALVGWKKEKISFAEWLLVLVLNQYFFLKTSTDAVYMCVIALFIGWLFLKTSRVSRFLEKSKMSRFIFSHSALLFAILTIVLQLYYNTHASDAAMIWLNDRLSTRLVMGLNVFERYSTGRAFLKEMLLGLNTESATYLDSSYLAIMTHYGVPLLLVFCFFMDSLGKHAYDSKDYYLAICVLIFMIHCITDPQLFSFRCNPLIITSLFYFKQKDSMSLLTENKSMRIDIQVRHNENIIR